MFLSKSLPEQAANYLININNNFLFYFYEINF